MKNNIIFDLPTFKDERGCLTVIEKLLPFDIERTFWIYGADNNTRGGHRHKKTRQALICLYGEVILNIDNGREKLSFHLQKASTCIIVEPEDWHTMTFKNNAILLVFASHKYNKNDYIFTPYDQ